MQSSQAASDSTKGHESDSSSACDVSKPRQQHGTSQRKRDKKKRLATLMRDVRKFCESLRQAEQQGLIQRFLVLAQDNESRVACDGSAFFQRWLRDASGLDKTIREIRTGIHNSNNIDDEEMNRMQELYPSCGTALRCLTVPDMRSLLSGLSWSKVKKAAKSSSLPKHMEHFNMHAPPLFMALHVDHSEHNEASTSADDDTTSKKRKRNEQGRYSRQAQDYDKLFDASAWKPSEGYQSTIANHINVQELFQKDPKSFNQSECVAALGLTMEFYNPGVHPSIE